MAPRPLRLTSPSLVLLLACGDAGSTTTADAGSSESTGDTGDAPTTADPPTSSSTSTSTSGQTGSATDDTGLGPTTSASSTSSTSSTSSSSTTTTESTDTTDATSTTTSSDTSTTDTSTTDTTTGDPPGSCLDVDFPVVAPLCGDGGPPCTLQRDELVSPEPHFRNDMPAIALRGDCGPSVIYSVAEGGYFGFYAERTGPDAWATEPTPMSIATGSLDAVPGEDALIAAVDDGAFGVSLWRRSGGTWQEESKLAGMHHTRAPQLVRDSADDLHLGHIDDDGNLLHTTYDGAWTKQPLQGQTEIHVRIALDPQDAPRLIAWSSINLTWQLFFVAPPAMPEIITNLGSNVLDHHHTALALVGADSVPWVLLSRKQLDQSHHDVVLAHRTGPGAWDLEVLIAENPGADQTCGAPPFQPGQICQYDYRRVYTTALVASATEVRALYTEIHHTGTLVAECVQNPQPFCFWQPMTDTSTGELRVAWPGAAPADHQVVADDVFTDRATARLDTAGAIHLAFYDYPPPGGDPVVRYLRVGP